MKKVTLIAFVLLVASSVVLAQGLSGLSNALGSLCSGIKGLIPIVSFLMIVSAGVIYAAGQLLDAETRARSSVWASAMLVGAIIGRLIVVITPSLVNALYSDQMGAATFSC